MKLKALNPPLWGFSIALSWTWGLGLFFSVQMAIQFGLGGLLAFAIPNAIGLIAFGWFTQYIAKRFESSLDFEKHFLQTVGKLRWVFLLYQVVAIALTFFALFKYIFIPLGVNPWLIALLMMGAGLLLGEQFKIAWLKWSHFAMSAIIILSILLIGWGGGSYFATVERLPSFGAGHEPFLSYKFSGFFIPIVVGLLLGPWLDIQQWQRAIQIRREKSNIGAAYTFGGLIFFGVLLFHGTLGLAIFHEAEFLGISGSLLQQSADGLFHAKDFILRFLFLSDLSTPLMFRVMYVIFLCLCIISTLDSGYVALKWFQMDALKKTDWVVLSLIPKNALESPILPFSIAAITALITCTMPVELEYYMAFYASFAVGYAMVFLFRTTFEARFTSFTQTTLFSLAAFSLGVFGIGYFEQFPILMIIGALVPLIHAIVCIATRKAVEEIKKTGAYDKIEKSGVMDRLAEGDVKGAMESIRPKEKGSGEVAVVSVPAAPLVKEGESELVVAQPDLSADVSGLQKAGSSWFEGKWFVHSLVATYQDTNSVGNVYFAQYGMWVGKTRELFFNHAIPSFNLSDTSWYVLTRSYEHKFLQESKEFERIFIKIRVAGFNRKFVTMEHQIYDGAQKLLGKGKQVLLFVSSKNYSIIDIPTECYKAFLPYI